MSGELQQKQVTGYYRRLIVDEMQKRPTLDFDNVAAEQWEEAITIPKKGFVFKKVINSQPQTRHPKL